ncbi:hypothetical protein G5I_03581 [Acromyrmex echinatior]|uniref:Uncharacterized protein n=1 Tax=Acromyrmex echinatior TaxID=103372 RepID=F4WDC8_ACREC|nr:hypothetical protein G5I_03581 [Acromyrmex echinatior]
MTIIVNSESFYGCSSVAPKNIRNLSNTLEHSEQIVTAQSVTQMDVMTQNPRLTRSPHAVRHDTRESERKKKRKEGPTSALRRTFAAPQLALAAPQLTLVAPQPTLATPQYSPPSVNVKERNTVVSWKTKESVVSVIDKHNMANHANNAVEYVRNADPEQFAHIRDEVFEVLEEMNFEELMDQEIDSDEETLSDDAGYTSDLSEIDTDYIRRIVSHKEARCWTYLRAKRSVLYKLQTTNIPYISMQQVPTVHTLKKLLRIVL